jgi:hypothetical protein
MASYIQGVQDNIEKVRPPQANLQFEAQLLQARQSKYDAGHKKLSDQYGKILNSGLTREDNIKARDDFFKLIDGDLRKVAGMDLSLESNVTKAQNVFSQVYENDYLVKDMVWTKNFQNEMKRAESFKNCVDPEKCGGEYWDGGIKYMQYKKQEFAETDNADSLNFSNAEYVPYNNVMAKAQKAAKDADLNITIDQVTGNYKVTTKNGDLLTQPLTALFEGLFAENPGLQKQFEVESYNERKDWASNKMRSGDYGTMQEAEVGYITEGAKNMQKQVDAIATNIGADNETLDLQIKALQVRRDNGEVSEGSDEDLRYIELNALKTVSDQAKGYADLSKLAMQKANNHRSIRSIGAQMDQASGLIKLDNELKKAVGVFKYTDAEQTMEEDEFAVMGVQHGYNVAMEGLKHANRISEENNKQKGRIDLAKFKGEGSSGVQSINKALDTAFKKVNGSGTDGALKQIENDAAGLYKIASPADLNKESKSTEGVKASDINIKKPLSSYKDGPEKRMWMELTNKANKDNRIKYIREAKARKIDEQNATVGITTNWEQQMRENGPDAIYQGGSYSESSSGSGGGNGTITNYTYGKNNYRKNNGTWEKKTNGSYKPLGGDVAARSAVLDKGAVKSATQPKKTQTSDDYNSTVRNGSEVTDKHIEILAQKTTGSTQKYYETVLKKAKKEGLSPVEYIKSQKDGKDKLNAVANRLKQKEKSGEIKGKGYYSKQVYDDDTLTDSALQYVANNVPSVKKREYYSNIIAKGGMEYLKNIASDEERELVYNNVGHRIEQSAYQYDGFVSTEHTTTVEGDGASKYFDGVNKTARDSRFGASSKITNKYLETLDENSDQFKSLALYAEDYLIKHGDINKHGVLSYNGEKIGTVYRDPDGIGRTRPMRYEGAILPKGSEVRKNLSLGDVERGKIMQLKNFQEFSKKHKYFAEAVYKDRIAGLDPDSIKGDWFKKDTKYDTEENPGFKTLQKEYNWNEQTHKMLIESKKEGHDVILDKFKEELGKVSNADAEMFIKNGQFSMPKSWSNWTGEDYKKIKNAYDEAMDFSYSKGKLNNYMVGAGSRVARDLTFFSPDITNLDNPGVLDVREFLRESQKAAGPKENLTRVLTKGDNGVWTIGTRDENAILFEKIFNGELQINNINYNPITGADPNEQARKAVKDDGSRRVPTYGTKNENDFTALTKGNTGDWSRMEIVLKDETKIVVDLSNEQTTKLFQKATNSTRANALNIVGQYEYMESGVLTGGGKDNPVKINRINNSTLGVTGKIWNWDFDAGKGVYRDLQEDVLDRLNLNFESPENLQVFIDLAYKTAQKDYDQYMPKVTK